MTDQAAAPLRPTCASCAAPLTAGWDFCGHCGEPVSAEPFTVVPFPTAPFGGRQSAPQLSLPLSDGVEDAPRNAPVEPVMSRVRKRKQPWLIAVTAVVACALLALGVVIHLGTRTRLTHTRDELASTSATLTSTKSTLQKTNHELSTTAEALTTRTSERDRLQARLDETNTKLAGVQQTLTDAQNRVNLQAGQIDALKSCLAGVTNALEYVSYGDYGSAVASLEAVEVSCDTAANAF